MKIAIHDNPKSFSAGWIKVVSQMGIDIVKVNAYSLSAIDDIKKCDAFMWNWHHSSPKDWLFARQLIVSLETAGVKVFPDIMTCWHFDDKLGQKYVFEALGLPAVKSWVFYDKEDALSWAALVKYPIVFKLRNGAGSSNVRLVKNQRQARNLISTMFGRGFPSTTVFSDLGTRIRNKWKAGLLVDKLLQAPKIIRNVLKAKVMLPRQRGYVYFQEYIPNNNYDTRIVVIGDKAIGIRRYCRPDDFRASGSGAISYEKADIHNDCIKIAFDATRQMHLQCGAFDFVRTESGGFLIVEVSYAFTPDAYYNCQGYWTPDMVWHDEKVFPEKWMVEELILAAKTRK